MTVFSKTTATVITSAATATTSGAGTFGTAQTIKLSDDAKYLIGMIISGRRVASTAALGTHGIVRLNCDSIPGLNNRDFSTGPYVNSPIGTQNAGQYMVQDIIPLDYQVNGGETISLSATVTSAATSGCYYDVALQYANSLDMPSKWQTRYGIPSPVLPLKGSKFASAQQLTTTRTALTGITIPPDARAIVGVKAVDLKEGAVTTAEPCGGYFELTSTITGWEPQHFPTTSGGAQLLGTLVDTQAGPTSVPWIPTWIPCPGQEFTITPYINLRHAVTTGNSVSIDVAWI